MTPRPRRAVDDIPPYVAGESRIDGRAEAVKLSANEGAFGPPPSALEAARTAMARMHEYPDPHCTALRHAIGARFGLDPARIVCGAGSDDPITNLCLAYGGDGTELVMTRHGFSVYRIAGRFAGCRVIEAEERKLTADVDAILACVTPRTKLVFLANPNNPTGTLLPGAEVLRLRESLPDEVLLVLDAAYAEYVEDPDYEPGAALVEARADTVMTRTFSKIWGMGGLRLGWAYAPEAVAEVLNRVRIPFNVSTAAQEAGIAALAEPGWLEKSRAHNAEWKRRMVARLTAAGIRVWPSATNFLLADFGAPARAQGADAFLRGRGLIVRRVDGYGLPCCLRITIGPAEACARVIAALEDFMAGANG